MAFTGNKLSLSRKHKEPLHLVSALNGAVPVIGKVTSMEDKWKCTVALLAAIPAYGNLERLRKKLSIIEASSPERTSDINALKEAKNTIELFERLYGNAKTGASGLSHGRKIKDNLQDIITISKITSLKNKTKKSKTHDLGDKWEETVEILRVCTDGKVSELMEFTEYYGDKHHGKNNKTSCFGENIGADEIPYIVLPDNKKTGRFKYSLGVITKKGGKGNGNYLYCVVAETGPKKIQAKNLMSKETKKNKSITEQEKEVQNTLGEVSIYAAWKLAGLNTSSIDTTKTTSLRNTKYMIGNNSVEKKGVKYEIKIFETSSPSSFQKKTNKNKKTLYGWKYEDAEEFRKQITDTGDYLLKLDKKKCLNIIDESTTNKNTTRKKKPVKKILKRITAFFLFALLFASCQRTAIKAPKSTAVKEETAQPTIKTAPEKQEPVQEKEKKLSEIYDWESARIIDYPCHPNFGEGQVLQNKDYVFYPEDGFKIARISKTGGTKKIICRLNPAKKEYTYIYYCLSNNGLFIEYNGNVYSCDFNGDNLHKIISRKKLKKQVTAIEPDAWDFTVPNALKFHQSSLYISIGYFIWKLDLKTKKITKMSERNYNACLCGSTLYYTDVFDDDIGILTDDSLYKIDTHTGKTSHVTKKTCEALTEVNGKLYYVHNCNVYMYRKGKKDKKIFSFNNKIKYSEILHIRSDLGKIAINYLKDSRYIEGKDPKPESIAIYDIRTSAFSKIENIRNFYRLNYFDSDMLFYSPKEGNDGGYLSSLSYPQPASDKTFKTTRESSIQPGSTKGAPQENQVEKLSDKYDWDSAKITTAYSEPTFGNGPVLQNENYIFYPEDDCKIIRINKKDKTVKIVCRFDPAKKKYSFTNMYFCLSDSRLFIIYAGNIYSCSYEGKDFHKILSKKKLKKITHDTEIDAICFHKGSLYLSSYLSSIYRLDLETNKTTKISNYGTSGVCLCGNILYYAGNYGCSLYKTDTRTGKRSCIKDIGTGPNADATRYAVTAANGKPYYLKYEVWGKSAIYMYRKGKKDKKIWESDLAISQVCCSEGKIAIQYYSSQKYDVRDNNVLIYDINTSTITKIENIPDILNLACLSGDMLFYTKNWDDKYLSYLAY